jgi:hypothetical protein
MRPPSAREPDNPGIVCEAVVAYRRIRYWFFCVGRVSGVSVAVLSS